jgi:xanthine dehydrogenase accessory factor
MRDLIADLKRWQAAGKREIALATIVATRGSSLRPAGTRMAITAEGDIAGSISSGCVDSDIIAVMEAFLQCENVPFKRLHFGAAPAPAEALGAVIEGWGEVSDRPPIERVGLACGGELDVIIERWGPAYDHLMAEVEAERAVGFAMYMGDRGLQHLLYRGQTDRGQTDSLSYADEQSDSPAYVDGQTDSLSYVVDEMREVWPGPYATTKVVTTNNAPNEGGEEVFIEVIPPPPVLLIFGATDIATSLTRMAQELDYHVIVSDARRAFLTEARFPGAELRLGWPQDLFTPQDIGPNWAIVVLFHDPKLDGPALSLALRSEAMYVGLLGSRKTQAERRAMLREMGFGDAALARIHGPVGLNIGGKHPAMIALSILSEIVAVRNGGQTSPPGPLSKDLERGGKGAHAPGPGSDSAERGRKTASGSQSCPYEPPPIPAKDFHKPGRWTNINYAPYDIDAHQVGAAHVIYKRAAAIKRVRYTPLIPAPEMPEPWQGQGEAIVRWLFSECGPRSSQGNTQEGLVKDQALAFVHDTTLMAGASSGMQAHPDTDEILYVIAGEGMLYHRPTDGSPVIARPLRPGDAVLIRGGEYHCIANGDTPADTDQLGEKPLRLMVIGVRIEN